MKAKFATLSAAVFIVIASVSFILFSCQKNAIDKGSNLSNADKNGASLKANLLPAVSSQMVLTWNNAGIVAITRMAPLTGTGPLPPMPESRIYAMLNIAMHDALNTIVAKYKRYALKDAIDAWASPDAAVAQAAHDVIVNQLPPQQSYADSLLAVSLNGIGDGMAKTKGIALGKSAALAIINLRANDGLATAQYPIPQGTMPGQYRSTPPYDAINFIAAPGWGKITPFALMSDSQFRAIPPYRVNGIDYAKDLNEMKNMGGAVSKMRTPDQTQFAQFWLPNAPLMFDNIARTLLAQNSITDAWQTARLLALVQIAEADANIGCLEGKFHYFFWRPYTAIHLADNDGNVLTTADPNWEPLAPPTPPVPDYPSNHACNGDAAAAVMVNFFRNDAFSFTVTSPYLPGVTRSFKSISAAAHENGLSRIYVGYHFRNAVNKGEDQGYKIGTWVFTHVLQPM